MKKIFNILFIGIGLAATSCSELPEYELPYELSPVTEGGLNLTVTPENAVCPAPIANFTVDSESIVYYVVVPNDPEIDPLTSEEVWDRDTTIEFEQAGTEEILIDGYTTNLRAQNEAFVEGLEPGQEYIVYAVTVNENGTRSDVVQTATLTMPTFREIADVTLTTNYEGTAFYQGSPVAQFDLELQDQGDNTFSSESLWGGFLAWAFNNPDYSSLSYPGTLTLNSDFSVTVESAASYSMPENEEDEEVVDEDGEGTFDPCTGIWTLTLLTNIVDDPETEVVEPLAITVELVPAEIASAE